MATIIHLRNDGRHCYVTQRFKLVEYMLLLIAINLTETGDERAHLREVGRVVLARHDATIFACREASARVAATVRSVARFNASGV